MTNVGSVFFLGVAVLMLSGCSSMGGNSCGSPADKKLGYGVLSYEEGNYAASMTALQGVLDSSSAVNADKVRAYKYMAFIHCVSSREKICRDNFQKALEIDPHFDLEPAEAGHPIWGPVFRSVKNKITK